MTGNYTIKTAKGTLVEGGRDLKLLTDAESLVLEAFEDFERFTKEGKRPTLTIEIRP